MPNVIKQRQLSDGTKLTPKTMMRYTGQNDDYHGIYTFDVNVKYGDAETDGGATISIGKGEYAVIDLEYNYDEAGNDIHTLEIRSKETDSQL
ncbi:MAG: hypothetical protein ACK5MR_16855 [Cumulibacter sp.]